MKKSALLPALAEASATLLAAIATLACAWWLDHTYGAAVLGVAVGQPNSTTSIATTGVPIAAVTAGGVGAKAGLKVGDVVTGIDGQQVTTADALIAAVRNNAPGTQVKVTYTRSGKSSDVTVTLGSSDS